MSDTDLQREIDDLHARLDYLQGQLDRPNQALDTVGTPTFATLALTKAGSGIVGPTVTLNNTSNAADDQAQIIFQDAGTDRAYINFRVRAGGAGYINIYTGPSGAPTKKIEIDENGVFSLRLDASGALGPVIRLQNEANALADKTRLEFWDTTERFHIESNIIAGGAMDLTFRDVAGSRDIMVVSGSGNSVTVKGAFGTNGATAQTAFASGGALAAYVAGANGLDTGAHMSALVTLVANIRAALVANGIMS